MRLDCDTLSVVSQFPSFAVAEPHVFVSSAVVSGFVADSFELALFAIVLRSAVESIDFFDELFSGIKRISLWQTKERKEEK